MNIQFLGAAKTVTGSKYLVTVDGKKILVDCGLFQGLKELRLRNWRELPFPPHAIDAVILTHAHIDHSGYLPLLVKNGFAGKIYCSAGTHDLCNILLPDSGYLQEEEANRANKYGYSKHKPALPLYTREDANLALQQFVSKSFGEDFFIDNLKVTFHRGGHILGASMVMLRHEDKSLLFSGDLGRTNDPIINPPEKINAADYLVIESTYGDRAHESVDPQDQLAEVINRTVHRGGTLIIPSFAVGRAQNILYYIYKLKQKKAIPDLPVFLDSPMATDVTEIVLNSQSEYKITFDECRAAFSNVRYTNTVEDSKLIDTYVWPKIVISASGMATGGRVLHHLRVFAEDAKNTILFAGYQALGTRGYTMLQGVSEIKLLGEVIKVNADVIALNNMSAHADYNDILAWLKNFQVAPKKVFITHGELHAAKSLSQKIQEQFHWNCIIPDYLQIDELN
jgi:metallo-beta-lactamase family protein